MADTLYVHNISQGRVRAYPFTHGVRYYTGDLEVMGDLPHTLEGDDVTPADMAHYLWVEFAEATEPVSVGAIGTWENEHEITTHRWWVA